MLGVFALMPGCNSNAPRDKSVAAATDVAQGYAGSVAPSAPAPALERQAANVDAAGGAAKPADAGSFAQVRDTSASTAMIIRNGAASVLVDSLDAAVARVELIAAQLGGYVANKQMQTGQFQVRSATLELKIPSARYDQAVNGLRPVGKLEFANSTAEDVGEEFVDVSARMNNAHRLEERLITLIATRTGKLQDVLEIERELARVREDIERYEGRLRFLKSHVAMSTLSVTVHEKIPVVASPGENIIGEAFVRAWRSFVRLVAGAIASLGWVVPLAVMAGVLVWAARRFLRLSKPSTA